MTFTQWLPPEDPDPSEILHSAVDDKRDGRYSIALGKHLWYHHNALKYSSSQFGVRLSFALGYWLDLAAVYTPAKDAFVQTRDDAEASFERVPKFNIFCDVAALNNHLQDDSRIADLFSELADKDPDIARRLYGVAEKYLVSQGRYRECGPFLDVQTYLKAAAERYRHRKQRENVESSLGNRVSKLARRTYVKDIATLVALLSLNSRSNDALIAYNAALQELDSEEFRAILDAALAGHFPAD